MGNLREIYCVRRIGRIISNESENSFVYKKKTYEKLFSFDFETLYDDINKNKDFSLKTITSFEEMGLEYLAIFFEEISYKVLSNLETRARLLLTIFQIPPYLMDISTNIIKSNNKKIYKNLNQVTGKLYKLLSNANTNKMESIEWKQPNNLKPVLKDYQKNAVKWLVQRENFQEYYPNDYHLITSKDCSEIMFYYHPSTMHLMCEEPKDFIVPTGGILADEMGLGKTVEILALILTHQRCITNENPINYNFRYSKLSRQKNKIIYCICRKKSFNLVIECTICKKWQHKKCVRKYSTQNEKDNEYICPQCWYDMPLTVSKSTIIVSPTSIKMQWYTEIKKHVSPSPSVLIYEGIGTKGWISPKELSSYDIILTNYNVLQREIYYSNRNENMSLRRNKDYICMQSPLIKIHWWRVCLDEAQMVESSKTKAAQMVKLLPAVHRWAVTGTPIQKSLDDIRGILNFLDLWPYYENIMWNNLSQRFHNDDPIPLVNILSKIMWRTCKFDVIDELGIPIQEKKLHIIKMSNAESLFYKSHHGKYTELFEEKVKKFASSISALSNLDNKKLKMILEPLKRLRQDCTIPVLIKKGANCLQVSKKYLQPQELLTHLKTTNLNECKSELRTIVSCLNGIAGIYILKLNFEMAIDTYNKVLECAKRHTGPVCVDTLLQIHALHNLIEAHKLNSEYNNETFSDENNLDECSALEWKYLESYCNNLKNSKINFESANNALKIEIKKFKSTNIIESLRNLMYKFENQDMADFLINRINDERKESFGTSAFNNFNSLTGVDYLITTWSDKLSTVREEVIQKFKKFDWFIENAKPKNQIPKSVQEEISMFIKKIFDCHLKEVKKTKRKKSSFKIKCEICEAKTLVDKYECMIFNKVFDKRKEYTEGSWNPTLQETIIKIIFNSAKSKNMLRDDIAEAEIFINCLELMKKEFKALVKLWIEIEYCVKAHDELDMCKLRLQTFNEEIFSNDDNKSIHQLSVGKVDLTLLELQAQLKMAETQFVKKSARLNYIRHLEVNTEPVTCPICQKTKENKYSVLECGHYICISCLQSFKKIARGTLICAICRNEQKYEDVYYVTRKKFDGDISIKGAHSSKIENILRVVMQLKTEDPDVKIIVFSHWNAVLRLIAEGLQANNLSFRYKPTIKATDDFKSEKLNITCLLLLLAHGAKGLNLVEATHVFFVEPILNPGEELQAIGRVHRIGQTKKTMVHYFIAMNTIEEKIYRTITSDRDWDMKELTIDTLRDFFSKK